MRKALPFFASVIICLAALAMSVPAATVSPALNEQLNGVPDNTAVGTVIVAFNTATGLAEAHLELLRTLGIPRGITLPSLGMVAVAANAGQVRQLAANRAVRSVWSNDRLQYFDKEARTLTGVERVRTDSAFTRTNGGLPVSGKGDFSVVINDSGIDATHDDLKLGSKVIQNIQIVTDTDTLSGFTPLVTIENVPDTDVNVGHGTHCAGILGGTGQASGGRYAGVAPGAKLIGTGSGAALFILNALGGFEWSIANQAQYSIRVISNSFGGSGSFNPDNPLNIATKEAHDRNIVVVFAAGNSGPGRDTLNPYAKAPWVIGVGAGTKEGGLASFSSRGTAKAERLANADPYDDYDAPTLVAPGTGREFETNAARFSSAYVSTRSKSNLFANGLTDDAELPVAYVASYTQISGTSMATPHLAGVVVLMLDADPTLSPDEVKEILTQTASRMPGYEEFQVGAGYVNAYAAVDKVFNRAKNYGAYSAPAFNAQFTVSGPAPESVHIDYSPLGLPGPGGVNSRNFTVQAGMNVLDVFAKFDNALETGDGNTIGLLLTAPNGTRYSSGIALPILDSPSRQVVVKNPQPGNWLLEVRGVRGLAALPNFSLPTSGAALPGPVDIKLTQQLFTLAPIGDVQGHSLQTEIEAALRSRLIDSFADGTFRPDAAVTREDFARNLVLNTALRQSLAAAPYFTDVSGSLAAIAEAVTAKGSTLRDWDFTPLGMMSASGTTFNPAGAINRLDLAVAFVRALGFDAEARALANSNVTSGGVTLSDNAQIPTALRGYVQLAIDKGLLEVYPAEVRQIGPGQFIALPGPRVEPTNGVTRATLAAKLNRFAARFAAGN